MSITVVEKWDSQRITLGESPSVEISYLVMGTAEVGTAVEAMTAFSPSIQTVSGIGLTTAALLPRQTCEITGRLTANIVEGRVVWGFGSPPDEGDELLSFDTGGGSQKIFQSSGTRRYAASGYTAPNFQGAIGVGDDGNIEGVDVPIPALSFSKQRRFNANFVTQAYLNAVAQLTGSVNAAPFFGFAAYSVRFDGATGQQRPGKPWDVTFKFTVSPNATNLSVGPITGIQKRGWEYLWCRYRTVVDTSANRLVKVPYAAYVEQVLPVNDFSVLGLSS